MLFFATMDLITYIADMDQRKALAEKCGTSPEYLWQVATGWRDRKPSIDLAKKIEEATGSEITRQELRPDVFGEPAKPVEQGAPAKSEAA